MYSMTLERVEQLYILTGRTTEDEQLHSGYPQMHPTTPMPNAQVWFKKPPFRQLHRCRAARTRHDRAPRPCVSAPSAHP